MRKKIFIVIALWIAIVSGSSPLKIVTLSPGVATVDKEGMIMSDEDLIKRADEALCKAKESGRNRMKEEESHDSSYP